MADLQVTPQFDDARARAIADEAVASLCGLVLRRLQDDRLTRSAQRNQTEDIVDEILSGIFGEALQQFSQKEKAD